MKELINELVEKVGLSPETAEKATSVVVDFMKSKLPEGLSDKVEGLLGGDFDLGSLFGGGSNGTETNIESNPLEKLSGLFGK